jgi:uncharacterized membrane protein YfcA
MLQHPLVIMLVGVPIGILMGLTSFTGAIIVPSLVLLYGVAQAKSQGTAVMLTMSPLQVPAMWNFYRAGNIDWRMVKLLIPGIVVGTFIGSWLANTLPPAVMKTIFGTMMVYVGAYMLMLLTTANAAKAIGMALIVAAFAGLVMFVSRSTEVAKVA